MFLVLLLVLVSSGLSKETCPNICTFVHINPDWADGYDSSFVADVKSGTLGPGIVTAEYVRTGGGYMDHTLYFRSDDGNYPLMLRFSDSQNMIVQGQYSWSSYGYRYLEIPETSDYFQITDQNPDNYVIIAGDSNSKKSFDYNYGSEDTWKTFQRNNVRLRDVTRIDSYSFSPEDSIVFKYLYISICPDATPRLCDDELSTVKEAKLGEPYTLTCTATGAPFLAASWIKDGEIKQSSHSYLSEGPDHRITSNIDIMSFKVDDIGKWTCSVSNKNFGGSVTKTHELKYSREMKLEVYPPENFYIQNVNGGTIFEWIVTGWPLDQVTLQCDDVDDTQITIDTNGHRDTNPPSVNLMLTLQKEDKVFCTVKDGTKVLGTASLTRVGYGCVVGEKGVGKDCEVCSIGETSLGGTPDCFAGASDCQEGFYGTGEDCVSCPNGKSSPAGSVKIQECLKISSKTNIPLVVGASIAAALFTAGLILLLPRLKQVYESRVTERRDPGAEEGDVEKTQEPCTKVTNAETDRATTNNQEMVDMKTRKAERNCISDSLAYEDGNQEYYFKGAASEKRAPPLPPRKEGPPREVTKKKTAKNRKGKSPRKSQFQQELEGNLASKAQVAPKDPDGVYIDNTIVPEDDHYYEDLDNQYWALPENADSTRSDSWSD